MANQVALLGAIKVVIAGVKDLEKALEPNQSLLERAADLKDLISAAIEEAKVIGDIKAEIASLQPSDYIALAAVLVSDLELKDSKAKSILDAALKLLADGLSGSLPGDIKALLEAVKA